MRGRRGTSDILQLHQVKPPQAAGADRAPQARAAGRQPGARPPRRRRDLAAAPSEVASGRPAPIARLELDQLDVDQVRTRRAATAAPTLSDRLTGQAKAMEEQYAVDLAAYAQLVDQARNVALVNRRARERQVAALERLRKDAEASQRYKLKAARLLEENKILASELAGQKLAFQEQLTAAGEQVKTLLAEVGRLKGNLQAAAALVHTWRARLQLVPDAHGLGLEDEARSISIRRPG